MNVMSNRNNAVGDFAAFAPERLSLQRLVLLSRKERKKDWDLRTSRRLLEEDGLALVRYRLGSAELEVDCAELGTSPPAFGPEFHGVAAVFGVLDANADKAVAILEVLNAGPEGLVIHNAHKADGVALPPETMGRLLDHIDVPACARNGIDKKIVRDFDLWRDAETGRWSHKPPLHVVVVAFERLDFNFSPVLRESVEVFLPAHESSDIEDADPEAAYWAKAHYRDLAWERLRDLPQCGPRPRFSSWLHAGDPFKAKVLDAAVYAEVTAMRTRDEAAENEPLAPPRP